MKLSPEVEQGVRQLLEPLNLSELQQLAQTVTNQLLTPDSRAEALDMIVRFSESAGQLLRRQKVSRQLLVRYVDAARVTVPPGALSKHELVAAVLEAWRAAPCRETHQEGSGREDKEGGSGRATSPELPQQQPEVMSLAFCRLFFEQLNNGRVDSALFWQNTRACLTLRDGATVRHREEVHSPSESARLLSCLSVRHGLALRPNTAPAGLQTARDKFGRHALAVCGTAVHRESRAGLFQLGALLAPGPADQCWRLVLLDLTVVAQPSVESFSQGALPSLLECGLSVADIELQSIEYRSDEVT